MSNAERINTEQPAVNNVRLPPYDGDHLLALGKKYCASIEVQDSLFEDAVQEFVLGGLLAQRKCNQHKLPPRSYQYWMGKGYVLNFLNRENRRRKRFRKSLNDECVTNSGQIYEYGSTLQDEKVNDPSEEAIFREHMELLLNLLFELPDDQINLLHLRFIEELPFETLGEKFNVTLEAARQRYKRIIANMQNYFTKSQSPG